MQKRLQFLQQDNRIERLNAELRPGVQRGESDLNVRVQETFPFGAVAGVNNYQSPTVGAERLFISLAHRNLTGNGDAAATITHNGAIVAVDGSSEINVQVGQSVAPNWDGICDLSNVRSQQNFRTDWNVPVGTWGQELCRPDAP